jgi:hypothetical protein
LLANSRIRESLKGFSSGAQARSYEVVCQTSGSLAILLRNQGAIVPAGLRGVDPTYVYYRFMLKFPSLLIGNA